MSKDYGNVLKKIVINYLKQSKNKNIFFADSENKYDQNQFSTKVFKYQSELEKIWKNQKKNRGLGILLDRNTDYIAIILATWLCDGYYVPLSIHSPKKNINYQINNSNLSLIVHKKKGEVEFKKILNKKKIKFKSMMRKLPILYLPQVVLGKKKV